VQVRINGKTMRAMLDTGASISTLNRTAAEKAGLDLSDSSAQPDEAITGIGSKARRSWNVRLASFGIGGEEIRNATIRVMDAGFDPLSDMVLGADFFLAHHVLASYTQRLIYLTYNGGPVFSLDNPASAGGAREQTDPQRQRPGQALRRPRRDRQCHARRAPRRDTCADRPQRRRQDHADLAARRRAATGCRDDRAGGTRHWRAVDGAAHPPRPCAHLPDHLPASRVQRARQRRHRHPDPAGPQLPLLGQCPP
ncbi:MAG: retropepsin-like domain-containing protein, partial [Mesorhizobium sp.]|nr:retropepsin-like domain-containing protein [Mesorhizobium sp.]